MSLPIHFIHFADTIDNVISGMGDDQSGIINDGTAGVVGSYLAPNPAQPFRLGSNVYFPALSRSCNFGAGAKGTHTWSYYNETFNDINALGDIAAAHYITGYGDSDTRLSFATANDIYMQAGGYGILELYAVTGTPALKVNPSAIDVDTIISANGITNALVVDGGTGDVGFGTASLAATKLTIQQNDGDSFIKGVNATTPRFALNGNVDGSWVMYDYADGSWKTGITQKGGKLGVGTPTPGCALCVNGGVSIGDDAATADNNLHVVGAVDVGGALTVTGSTIEKGDVIENETQTHSWTGTDVTVYDVIASFETIESGEIEIMSQFVNGGTMQSETLVLRYTNIAGAAGVKITTVYNDGDVTGSNINALVSSGKIRVTHNRGGALGSAGVSMWIRLRRFQKHI